MKNRRQQENSLHLSRSALNRCSREKDVSGLNAVCRTNELLNILCILRRRIRLYEMSVFDLSCTELDEIQNHDDFIVVWASPNDVPSKLNYLVDYLKKYHSQENCIDYIKQVKSDRKMGSVVYLLSIEITLYRHEQS